jgi:hypothetical protein
MQMHNVIWSWYFSMEMELPKISRLNKITKNEIKVFEWYLKLAEQRNANTHFNLRVMFDNRN